MLADISKTFKIYLFIIHHNMISEVKQRLVWLCAVLTPIVERFPVGGIGINYSDLEI